MVAVDIDLPFGNMIVIWATGGIVSSIYYSLTITRGYCKPTMTLYSILLSFHLLKHSRIIVWSQCHLIYILIYLNIVCYYNVRCYFNKASTVTTVNFFTHCIIPAKKETILYIQNFYIQIRYIEYFTKFN